MSMRTQQPQKVIEKVYVALDVNNLWYSCRDIFGVTARVNFNSILNRIKNDSYKDMTREVTAIAYTITSPHRVSTPQGKIIEEPSRNSSFLESLKKMGYQVKTRQMKYEKGLNKPLHSDWDVGIAVDIMCSLCESGFDTFVIISGDGDYIPLINRIQKYDKRVEVYTFEKTASKSLYSVADHIMFLTESDIYYAKV